MQKVVIIFGSPRKDSNTSLLMQQAVKGLQTVGIESQIFYLNTMNIMGCQACYYCKRNNISACAVSDDMQKVYTAINGADGIIIATPIYFGTVTAQTKIWLDRMFPYIDIKAGAMLPKGKKASFIFTQNQGNPSLFTEQLNSIKFMVMLMGFEIRDTLVAADIDKGYKPMVTDNPDFMEKAFEIGNSLLK